MKTIEEKAKAYDEALERAEHVKLTNTKEIVAAAEYIFPELKESEDEKIRKQVIDIIQSLGTGVIPIPVNQDKILAWLEKQKEQKPIVKIPKFRAGDTIHLKSSNAEYTIEAISSSGYHGKGWSLTFDAEPDYELVSEDKEKQKEQKPAEWSEEDEAIVKFYEDDYNHRIGNMPMNDVVEMRLKFKDWLINRIKYLRPQPKPSWSEEDEKMISSIIMFLAAFMGNEEKIDFLKSIRPHWKPSEAQTEALKGAVEFIRLEKEDSPVATVLESLLKQLESL